VFFSDAGTVTDDFSLFASPRLALGFGIRILIPALSPVPIAIDFAVPAFKSGDDDTEFLYFSVNIGR